SMTTPAPSKPLMPWRMVTRLRASSAASWLMVSFFAIRARLLLMAPSARLSASWLVSRSATSCPANAQVCAMPDPMVPAPMTATFIAVSSRFALVVVLEANTGVEGSLYHVQHGVIQDFRFDEGGVADAVACHEHAAG